MTDDFSAAAIFDHADLRSAVAHQIGERLGKSTAERAQFAKIARDAFLAAPDLVEAASRDLRGIAVLGAWASDRAYGFAG